MMNRLCLSASMTTISSKNLIDLLTLKNPPSAFITSNSRLTFKFLKSLSALDLAYPEDFSVVGFVNIEWSEAICPSLTVLTPKFHPNGATGC